MDYIIEGTASLVTDQATREAVATAFEQAYGWQLTREDGTWYQLGTPSGPGMFSSTGGAEDTAAGWQPCTRRPWRWRHREAQPRTR